MHPVNKVNVVYTGSLPKVEIRKGTRTYHFPYNKSVSVAEDLALDLLKKPDFQKPEDLVRSVSDRCPKGGVVVLRRWGALGDLLMFRAACAALQRARPDLRLVLKCQPQYMPVFAADPLWVGLMGIGSQAGDTFHHNPAFDEPILGEFNLDRAAEVDHGDRGMFDRVTLFLEKLMTPSLEVQPQDWEIPLPSSAISYVDAWMAQHKLDVATEPLIALQVRGSGPQKTIPKEQLQRLCVELTKRGNVVLIENGAEFVWKQPKVYSMTGRDALHSIALMRRCALTVTTDSGALWLAHSAPCPVFLIAGPRDAATRTNRHPWGAKAIQAAQMNNLVVLNQKSPDKVGCPPCFEQGTACAKRWSCIREHPDAVLFKHVLEGVDRMLGDKQLDKLVRSSRRQTASRKA